jgi:hypothetical protein
MHFEKEDIPMKLAKTMIATMAAAGLIATPVAAQAAPARTASPTQQSEEIAGKGTILYVALAAFAIAMGILLFANDDDDLPTSP